MKKLILLLSLLIVCSQAAFSQITAAISVDENGNLVYPLDGKVYITNTNAEFRFSGSNSVLNVTNSITNGLIRSDDLTVRDRLVVSNNVGIGISTNTARLHVRDVAAPPGIYPTFLTNFDIAIFENYATNGGATINLLANPTNGRSEVGFSSGPNRVIGLISYRHDSHTMMFAANFTDVLLLNSNNVTSLTNFFVNGTGNFNTNVNISGNLTNIGNAVVGGTLTVTNAATLRTNVNILGNLTNSGSITINTANTVADATNIAIRKDYVDTFPLILYYDATGVANETNSVGTFLTNVAPPASYPTGKIAKILVTRNEYTLSTNTASLVTSVTGGNTLSTSTALTSVSISAPTQSITDNLRATTTSSVLLTNNQNTARDNITFVTSASLTPSSTSFLTAATLVLTNNTTTAITSVTINTNVTRRLYEYTDSGTSWGTPTVTTNNLQ